MILKTCVHLSHFMHKERICIVRIAEMNKKGKKSLFSKNLKGRKMCPMTMPKSHVKSFHWASRILGWLKWEVCTATLLTSIKSTLCLHGSMYHILLMRLGNVFINWLVLTGIISTMFWKYIEK